MLRNYFCGLALLFALQMASAQTPTDGIFMEKRLICTALLYGHDSWKEYWEGSLLRENGNVGTVTTQNVMSMTAAGLTDNLTVIVGLPYVWTKATGGTLAGQKGLQDLSLFAKYRMLQHPLGAGKFNVIAIGGLSTPVGNYNTDILPLGIGMGCPTASLRGMLNYSMDNGLYFTGSWAYIWRKNVELNRAFYWSDGPHYTPTVAMPAVADWGATLGFLNTKIKAELSYNQFICQGGSDIRQQDGPFVGNRMSAGRVSATVQYYLTPGKGFSLIASAGQVISGRNVGKSTFFSGGVAYQFGY